MRCVSHSKVFIMTATALLLAAPSLAKTWTQVFSQDFDAADAFKENFVNGTIASDVFGTSDSTETDIPDSTAHVQEQKDRYGATEGEKFYYYDRHEKSRGFSVIYKFPSSVTALADYKVEFDYYLSPLAGNDSMHSGLAIKGTQGIVATFDKQSGGGNDARTDGCILVYGNGNSQTNTFSTGARATDPSDSNWAGYWLHVTVYGNETDGLFLSVEQANGTAVLSPVRIGAFQPLEKLFFYGSFSKNYGETYKKCFSLDNVVACSGTADAFAWTGAEGDNKWSTSGNWTVGGETTTKYPEIGDAVSGLDSAALTAMDIAVKIETTGSETRFVNSCAKNVKVWTGEGANTLWTSLENWKYAIGDFTVYETPSATDTLRFPSSLPEGTEVSFGENTATADRQGFAMIVDGNVSFVAPGKNTRVIYPSSISGSGVLKLGDNIRIQTPTYSTVGISCDVEVDGAASLYLRGQNAKMTMSGALSGSGTLTLGADANGGHSFTLRGDMSGFAGTLEIPRVIRNDAAGCSYGFNGDDSTIDLSGAVVSIDAPMTLAVGGAYAENTLKVGALTGAGTITNATANAMTIEVGRSGGDASSDVSLAGTETWTVRKVGANRQTLTDGEVAYNLTLTDGEIALPVGKTLGTVSKTGGKFAFAVTDDTWTDGAARVLFTCADGIAAETLTTADVTLDQSVLAKTWLPEYGNSVANALSVTLTEAVFVWVGGESGRWDDISNWTVNGNTPPAAQKGGEKTTIDGATVLIDTDTDISGVTLSSDAKLAIGFTDSDLSYTIPEGFSASDFVAAGPYSTTENEGVLAATRVASTFAWAGGESGEWTDAANWTVGGLPTGVVPSDIDTVTFDSAAAVTVASDAHSSVIQLNGDVTFSGTKLWTKEVTGSGTMSVNGIAVSGQKADHLYVRTALDVTEGTNTFTIEPDSDGYEYIYFEGNISGSGDLVLDQRNRSGNASGKFSGDNSEFAGSLTVVNCGSVRDITTFDGANSTSSNAVYTVYGRSDLKGSVFISTNTTYRLGALNGSVYQQSANGYSPEGVVLEIGARNEDCSVGGDLNGTSTTIRKVGTAKLVCRASGIGNVEIESGVYEVPNNTQRGNIKFIGNGVFRSTIANDSSGEDIDYAKKLIGSTDYPIVFDDGGSNRTWTSAIPASNTAGFTKLGSGTLTLEKTPLYTGWTTVRDGTLVVPRGSVLDVVADAGTLTGATVKNLKFSDGYTFTPGVTASIRATGGADFSNVRVYVADPHAVGAWTIGSSATGSITGTDSITLEFPEGTDEAVKAKWSVWISGGRRVRVGNFKSGVLFILR